MISALFVVLFQTAAGQPAAPPAVPAAPAAATATAPAETDSEQQARLAALQERQKLVCRNEVVLGSRMPKRVCRSAAEEAAATDDSRAWIDRAQSQMATKGN